MKLSELTAVYRHAVRLSQQHPNGVTGINPIGFYIESSRIPTEYLEREVFQIQSYPTVIYGQETTALQVQLKGFETI